MFTLKKVSRFDLIVFSTIFAVLLLAVIIGISTPAKTADVDQPEATPKINKSLADANNFMKKAEEIMKTSGFVDANYYVLRAIYHQNEGIIELLRQKEGKYRELN